MMLNRMIGNRPELTLFCLLWTGGVLFHWLNLPVVSTPTHGYGLFLMGMGVAALFLGLLAGKPLPGRPQGVPRPARVLELVMIIAPFLSLLGAVAMSRNFRQGGETLGEIRSMYLEEVQHGLGGGLGYKLFLATMPLLLFCLDHSLLHRRKAYLFGLLLPVSLASFALIALSTGGRSELSVFTFFLAAGLVAHFRDWWLARKAKVFALACGCVVALVALNGSFAFLRLQGQDIHRSMTFSAHVENSKRALREVNLEWLPEPALYVYSYLIEYLANPAGYFGYFADRYEMRNSLGFYQFRLLHNRFGTMAGVEDPRVKKFEVDWMYFPTGATGNVWATAFREMIMDFGFNGFAPVLLLGGAVIGFCRGFFYRYWGARMLYLLGFTWLLFSPFSNFLLSRVFEMSCYYSVALLGFEVVTGVRLEWQRRGAGQRFELREQVARASP